MAERDRTGDVEPIHVLCAFDERYAPFAAVCVLSLASSRRSATPIWLHALTLNVAPATRMRLVSAWTTLGLRTVWHSVVPAGPPGIGSGCGQVGLSPHYLRLCLDAVLPAHVERCLYLDVDTLVIEDLQGLWSTPLDGHVVGACVDYLSTVANGVANFAELGLDPQSKYFNSGVLLVDVARWRGLGVGAAALDCTRKHTAHLDALAMFHQYDQYALNVVLYGQWAEIDSRWNHGSELEPAGRPAIIHFNGQGKPWSPTCIRHFRDLFYAHLAQAGYSEADLPR